VSVAVSCAATDTAVNPPNNATTDKKPSSLVILVFIPSILWTKFLFRGGDLPAVSETGDTRLKTIKRYLKNTGLVREPWIFT